MYESTMDATIGDCTLFHEEERNYVAHPVLLDYWNQGDRNLMADLFSEVANKINLNRY
jgi:hypothetical protein